jgi:hypothetical protein
MPKIVEVPGHGDVEFPDSMDDNAIAAQLRKMNGGGSNPSAASPSQAPKYDGSFGLNSKTTIAAAPEKGILDRAKDFFLGDEKTTVLGALTGNDRRKSKSDPLPLVDTSAITPKPTGVASSFTRGVADFAESMTDPREMVKLAAFPGVASMLGKAGSRLLSTYFTADMAKNLYEQSGELRKAWESGDKNAAARIVGEMLPTALMAGAAGKHAVKGNPPKSKPKPKPAPEPPYQGAIERNAGVVRQPKSAAESAAVFAENPATAPQPVFTEYARDAAEVLKDAPEPPIDLANPADAGPVPKFRRGTTKPAAESAAVFEEAFPPLPEAGEAGQSAQVLRHAPELKPEPPMPKVKSAAESAEVLADRYPPVPAEEAFQAFDEAGLVPEAKPPVKDYPEPPAPKSAVESAEVLADRYPPVPAEEAFKVFDEAGLVPKPEKPVKQAPEPPVKAPVAPVEPPMPPVPAEAPVAPVAARRGRPRKVQPEPPPIAAETPTTPAAVPEATGSIPPTDAELPPQLLRELDQRATKIRQWVDEAPVEAVANGLAKQGYQVPEIKPISQHPDPQVRRNAPPKAVFYQDPKNGPVVVRSAEDAVRNYARGLDRELAANTPAFKKALEANKKTQGGFLAIPNPLPAIRETAARLRQWKAGFEDSFVDSYSPLKRKGMKDAYMAASEFRGGLGGKIERSLVDFRDNVIRPADKSGVLEDLAELAKLERLEEIATRSQGKQISELPGGQSTGQIQAEIATLRNRLQAEGKLPEVERLEGEIYKYTDSLLERSKESGLISEEQYRRIKATNQKYVPLFRVMDALAENGAIDAQTHAFSVGEAKSVRKLKGSQRTVINPLESIIKQTHVAIAEAERNSVAREVAKLSSEPEFAGVVTEVTGKTKGLAQDEQFHVMIDGQKRTFQVPKEIGAAMKHMDKQSIGFVMEIARWDLKLLRSGATALNVAFAVPNFARDQQHAMRNSRYSYSPLDGLKGMFHFMKHEFGFKDDLYREFLASGAANGGYYSSVKKPSASLSQMRGGAGQVALRVLKSPFEFIQAMEQGTRVGVYERARKSGATTRDAAYDARNATVDFSKSGEKMRHANMVIPFVNARWQGTINTLDAFKRDPKKAALVTAFTTVAMGLSAYAMNQKYRDVLDDISDQDRQSNFILILGPEKDKKGNYTNVFKLPKTEVDQVIWNNIENFLEFSRGKDPQSWKKMLVESANALSPISFVDPKGNFDPTMALGQVVPPGVKAGIEYGQNRNLYTGRDIVTDPKQKQASAKEQYDETTPEIYRAIGAGAEKLGIDGGFSPKRLETAVHTQFGGFGEQVGRVASGLMKGDVKGAASGYSDSVERRVGQAYGGQKLADNMDQLNVAQREVANEQLHAERKATAILDHLQSLPEDQRAAAWSDMVSQGKVTEELAEVMAGVLEKRQKKEAPGADRFTEALKHSAVPVRAKLVADRLKSMPAEQAGAYFKELVESGVVTEAVAEKIADYLEGGR